MIYRASTSTIPIRAEPNDRSEMVSELIYGEFCTLVQESGTWLRIRSVNDGYEGWIAQEYEPIATEIVPTEIVLQESTLNLGTTGSIHLSPGSQVTEEEKNRLQSFSTGSVSTRDIPESTIGLAHQFLNTPYLWGGRSIWGIDCSGLIQVVFSLTGEKIPRDAYQQAELGQEVAIDQIETGDIAFFENAKGRITHVGIMVDAQNILHASGRVRIDTMDTQGIIRKTDGKRTHVLNGVRRF